MSGHNNANKKHSRRMALGGIFSALSIIFMFMGGILPIATFTAPAFAGLCLIPIIAELGNKTALLSFAATGILSFLLVPDREMVLFFVLLLGYYPILQPKLLAIKNMVLRYIVKLLIFNASVAAVYSLFLTLFATEAMRQAFFGDAWWMLAGMLLVANFTFVLYDILIDKVRIIYQYRFHNRFFK